MNKCKRCGNEFPNWVKINGQSKNLSRRSYCLECSPWGKGSAKRLACYQTIDGMKHKKCPVCKEFKTREEYHKAGKDSKYWQSSCKICQNQRTKEMARVVKQRAVEYKGDQCEKCQTSYPLCIYDFHHLNPQKKDFKISGSKVRNMSWELIQTELDKCALLCSNCHRLEHWSD